MTRGKQIIEEAKRIIAEAHERGGNDPMVDLAITLFFSLGARWADQHPRWISVEDELPPKQPNREQSKNVLVRTNSGRTKIEYYDYGNDVIKEWWEYNITHWMHLPQPPKGGEE